MPQYNPLQDPAAKEAARKARAAAGLPPVREPGQSGISDEEAREQIRAGTFMAASEEDLAATERKRQAAEEMRGTMARARARVQAERAAVSPEVRAAAEQIQREQFPTVEQRAAMAAERLPPSPGQAVAGVADASGQQAVQLAGALGATRTVSRANPMYGPTQEFVGRTRQAADDEAMALANIQEAKIYREQQLAEMADQQMREFQTQMAVDNAKATVQADRKQQALDAHQKIQDKIAAANEQLASAPDIDPGRFWANKTAFQKVMLVLSAGLLGAAGRDPFAHIQAGISDEIDAQKSNLAKRQNMLGARREELEAQRSIYGDVLADIEDERAADLIARKSYLEQAQRQLESEAARLNIPLTQGEAASMMAKFEQENAKLDLQLEQMAIATPERIYKAVPMLQGAHRAMAQEQLRQEREKATMGAKSTFAIAEEQAKAGAKGTAETEKDLQQRVQGYGDAVKTVEPAMAALQRYREIVAKEGVPTFEFGRDTPATAARQAAVQALTTQMFGAANDKQIEMVEDILSSSSQDRLLQILDAQLVPLQAAHAAARARYGDDAAAQYRAVSERALGSRRARAMPDAEDPVQVDQ